MATRNDKLNRLRIASPCTESWGMAGDGEGGKSCGSACSAGSKGEAS